MNFNNSKYHDIRNKVLIAKGIEQAWRRRFSHNIHSGVRVKIQQKNSSFIKPVHHELKSSSLSQTNYIQAMLKRLSFESETAALSENDQKLLVSINNSSENQTKSIFKNNFLGKNHLLEIKQKDKNVNSIGIQTIMRTQIDRQTSCNLTKATPILIRKNRSSTFISETSISDESSTHTDSTSTETSTVSGTTTDTNKYHDQRNKNRNNSAIDTNNK